MSFIKYHSHPPLIMNDLRDLFKPEFESTKPYRGFKNLAQGRHKIIKFELVKNRFSSDGEGQPSASARFCVMIELQDEVLFLPTHLAKKINNDPI